MDKYYYRVYGLEIESEIEINEFINIDKITDRSSKIQFLYGQVPLDIISKIKRGELIQKSAEEVYLYIEGVATYYIANGNKVVIDIYNNEDKNIVKIYLLGSVLGILMIQRKQLAIHGSSIVKNNKAVILTGDRGAGKSTLTTALRNRAYRFLSDDVAAIKLNNVPTIYHGFPYQKLCEDVVEKLGYDKNKYKAFKADEKIKYLVATKEIFTTENVELTNIFEICIENVDCVKIEKIKGHEKLSKILKNIYKNEYIQCSGGMSKDYFRQCVETAKHIDMYKIIRPYGKFTVDEQIKLIEEIL